jgi:hypothetical protein
MSMSAHFPPEKESSRKASLSSSLVFVLVCVWSSVCKPRITWDFLLLGVYRGHGGVSLLAFQ